MDREQAGLLSLYLRASPATILFLCDKPLPEKGEGKKKTINTHKIDFYIAVQKVQPEVTVGANRD